MDDISDHRDPDARTAGASGRFLIRMDPGLHAALREAARAAGTSLNDYCVRKLAAPGNEGVDAAARVVARAAGILGTALVGVVVFGSFARGQAVDESDIDVLVVMDRATAVTRGLYRRWDAAPLQWEGRPVEPHFAHMPAAGGAISGLWAEVALDGIVLFERDFEVSRRLAGFRSRLAAGELVRRWSNGQPYWVAA